MMNNGYYTNYVAERMVITGSGQYHDMMGRTLGMMTSREALDEFAVKTNNGLNANFNVLSSIASDIVTTNADTNGVVNIDQGWAAQRNVFVLILRDTVSGRRHILSGFSSPDLMNSFTNDSSGISQWGSLTFNNIISIGYESNYNGDVVSSTIVAADNILQANELNGGIGNNTIAGTIRPSDVLNMASTRADLLSKSDNMIGDDHMVMSVEDRLNHKVGSRQTAFSRAENAMPIDYLGRTVRAFNDSMVNQVGEKLSDVLSTSHSSQLVDENRYIDNDVISSILTNATQKRNVTITFGELENSLTNLRQVTSVSQNQGTQIGNQENWRGRSNEVRVASELSSACAALALSCGFAEIHFSINSNMDGVSGYNNTFVIGNMFSGGMGVVQNDVTMLSDGLPVDKLMHLFESRLRNIIFPTLARQVGRLDFIASIDTLEDMTIGLAIGGDTTYRTFTAPTFASSCWSPIGVATTDNVANMTKGMLALTNDLNSRINNSNPYGNSQSAVDYMASLPTNPSFNSSVL